MTIQLSCYSLPVYSNAKMARSSLSYKNRTHSIVCIAALLLNWCSFLGIIRNTYYIYCEEQRCYDMQCCFFPWDIPCKVEHTSPVYDCWFGPTRHRQGACQNCTIKFSVGTNTCMPPSSIFIATVSEQREALHSLFAYDCLSFRISGVE